MQEKQENSTSGGAVGNTPAPKKFNRRQRRVMQAFDRKQASKVRAAERERLANFKTLTAWKDRQAKSKTPLTQEQIDSVFRVALARLFKTKKVDGAKVPFERQLAAIVSNVKNGFQYKADVKPEAPKEG